MSIATRSTTPIAVGIDVGGTGIKGAPVDLETGRLVAQRHRVPTPRPATPDAVCASVAEVVGSFDGLGPDAPIGVTFPGPVKRGVVSLAVNLGEAWRGFDARTHLESALGRVVHVVNDADAAGVAEVHYGDAADTDGLVIVTTLGTGIGTAVVYDGRLIPNSELGHLEIDGVDIESRAANSVREREELSWPAWSARLQDYYSHLEFLFSPDLFVVGGGVSKKAHMFLPKLRLRTPIVPARLLNTAGIVGAARLAAASAAERAAQLDHPGDGVRHRQ